MYKRIIAALLCCALCAGFLILPAAASDLSSSSNEAGAEYVNLIPADDGYQIIQSSWFSSDVLSYSFTGSTSSIGFKWYPDRLQSFDYILFAVESAFKPTNVTVGFDQGSNYTGAIYEGNLGINPGIYFYRVSVPDDPVIIKFWFRFGSPYAGNFRFISCFGVKNYLSVYDRAEFTYVPIVRLTEGEYVEGTYSASTQMFPYTAPSWLNDSSQNITRVDFNLRCDGDRFNSSGVGNVYLLLNTFCEQITATVSLVAKDTSVRDVKNINVSIDKDSSWSLVNQYEVSGLGALYNNAAYQLSFDLTGYDMSKYDLQIFVSVENVPAVIEGGIDHKLFGLTFRSMTYVPTIISSSPIDLLTQKLSGWFSGIGTKFNTLSSNISSLGSRLINFLDDTFIKDIGTYILNAKNDIVNKLNSLLGYDSEQKDNIASSVDQNQQQQEQVQDQGESMKEQIDQIEQAENEMLQVPEIDPGTLQLGTLIPQSGITMMTNVMVTLTNNNYAATIILVVVSLALVAIMVL